MRATLAVDGGRPVRSEPLPPPYPGGALLGDREKQSVLEVLDGRSPFRYYGPSVQGKACEVERLLSGYVGTRHGLAVSSGTAALVVALRALGVGLGDEVIVPAVTFMASPLAVIACNAVPVFADVDASFSLDVADARTRWTPRTKAIMPVHLWGLACDMDAVNEFASEYELAVVEDCAQSLGAAWHGARVGGMGDVGAFSFQFNKVVTGGEGGAVTTDDAILHERAVRAHDQGSLRGGAGRVPEFCGENYRMSELTAAIVSVQLARIGDIIGPTRRVHARLLDGLRCAPAIMLRQRPDPVGDIGIGVLLSLPTEAACRGFVRALNAEGITFRRVYGGAPVYAIDRIRYKRTWDGRGTPFRCHPAGPAHYPDGLCPKAEDLVSRSAVLSLSPAWSDQHVRDVIEAVHKVTETAGVAGLERIASSL